MTTISDIRKSALPLFSKYGIEGATLFGSYARGEQTENSDIDMVLDVPSEIKPKNILAFAWELGKALGIEVDAYGSHELIPGGKIWLAARTEGVRL